MTAFPPTNPYQPSSFTMKPHRGTAVLVLGIIGLVASCVVCGIIAWVMGSGDLREMDEGRMDPSGRGMTNAGRILGMISVGLTALGVVFVILMMGFGLWAGVQSSNFAPPPPITAPAPTGF